MLWRSWVIFLNFRSVDLITILTYVLMDNFYPCLSKVQQYPNDVYKKVYSFTNFCIDLRKKTISLRRPCKIVGKVLSSKVFPSRTILIFYGGNINHISTLFGKSIFTSIYYKILVLKP